MTVTCPVNTSVEGSNPVYTFKRSKYFIRRIWTDLYW